MRTKKENQGKPAVGRSQREVLRDVMLSAERVRYVDHATGTIARDQLRRNQYFGAIAASAQARYGAFVIDKQVRKCGDDGGARSAARCGSTVCAECGVRRRDAIGSARRCYLHRVQLRRRPDKRIDSIGKPGTCC